MEVSLERKGLLVSMLYMLVTFRRTPVILVDGRLYSHGRVLGLEELRDMIRDAKREPHLVTAVSTPSRGSDGDPK